MQARKHAWIYTKTILCVRIQLVEAGFWVGRGKTGCGLGREHGRLSETGETRKVVLCRLLAVYRKDGGGESDHIESRVYK